MPTEDEIKPKVIDAFAHRTDLSPAAVAALVDARTDDPQVPVSAMRKGHTVAAQVSSGPCAGWRNQWTRALAFGLCVLLVGLLPARAAITANVVSTNDPGFDEAIDNEAKILAALYAGQNMKLGAEMDKAALAKVKITKADSLAAKRLLAQIRLDYPLLVEGRAVTLDIDPQSELTVLVKQRMAAAEAEKKAITQAVQNLKTAADAKTKEAEQADVASAAEKTLEAKALITAANTLAQSAAAPAASTPATTGDAPATTGASTDTSKTVKSDTAVVSGAKIQVADSLKLVTTNLFAGRAYLWGRPWSLEVTSTLPASTVDPTVSTTYSNAELQLPDGGILNIRTGLVSNLLNLRKRQDYFEAGSKVPIYGDRASEFDRYYFFGNHSIKLNDGSTMKEISVGDALIYFRDGIDIKGIYRPTLTPASGTTPAGNTPSTKVGDYGVGFGYYAGVGFDGGLFDKQQMLGGSDSGNFRFELMFTSQYADMKSRSVLFPNAVNPNDFSYAAGGRFVIALNNHLNLDVQALWPFGASSRYMKSTFIGGFSLTR